ncbi:MAG: DUF983 domain-containing protein [Ginsengibacter sp.]
MNEDAEPQPGLLWSLFTMRCPRCRRGIIYRSPNPYKHISASHIFDMNDKCPVCKQKFNLEPGFWMGTAYVSYAVAICLSAVSFIGWWIIIGISVDDNRVLYWLIFNGIVLLLLQPWLMRLSRVIFLYLVLKYNKNYENEDPVSFC